MDTINAQLPALSCCSGKNRGPPAGGDNMFFLERLEFQGTEKCPQYLWKQWAYCMKRAPLEKFLSKQAHPNVWRIEPDASEVERKRMLEANGAPSI